MPNMLSSMERENHLLKESSPFFGHGNVVGIGQALQENPGRLEVYQGRNEQGMAHAAMAFAKQNTGNKLSLALHPLARAQPIW